MQAWEGGVDVRESTRLQRPVGVRVAGHAVEQAEVGEAGRSDWKERSFDDSAAAGVHRHLPCGTVNA